MVSRFDEALRLLTNRLRNIALRGRLDRCEQIPGDVMRCQIVTDDGAPNSNVPYPQSYGHAALPPPGCRPFMVANGGDSGQGTLVAMADLIHVPALAEGDACTYDNRGQMLHFFPGGAALVVQGKLTVQADDIEWLATNSILTSIGGYAEKLTHVSEGQLVRDVWHQPATVIDQPDHGYPRIEEGDS